MTFFRPYPRFGTQPEHQNFPAAIRELCTHGDVIQDDFEGAVKDAALIRAAQRVEHYEIAAYGTVCAFAERLGKSEHAELLSETLEEEKQTDEKLTKLAEKSTRKRVQASNEFATIR